jgi:L-ascorbate metabolism protein UlaG (beta-lactamase superfamily)
MNPLDFVKQIEWLGHDAFRINASRTIYIDPYELSGGRKADLILISHEHYDHCSPEDVKKIVSPQTRIITEKKSAKKLTGQVTTAKPGDILTIDALTIQVTPAYNTNKKFHPQKNGWIGFVIEIDGVKIYHAGDTDLIPEMKSIQADIALLPVSGTYVMTAEEAAEAALLINPQIAIPMHYGSLVGGLGDAERFQTLLKGKMAVTLLPRSS